MRTVLFVSLLGVGCSLNRGLETDLCAPSTLAASLSPIADGVLVYRGNEEVERAGAPCQHAPDVPACEAELARLKPTEPRHAREHGPGALTLLLTVGGTVKKIDRASTWKDVESFPPLPRAQLWAEFRRGMPVLCQGKNASLTPEGVRVLVSSHDGCFGGSDVLLLVKPDGQIDALREKSYPQTCVG